MLRIPSTVTAAALVMVISLVWLAVPVPAEEAAFGGIGLQVVPTVDGDLVVLNVVDDAPAAEKGLLPGDMIFQVNGFLLKGSDFGKVVSQHLWGPVGASVELVYRRPGVAGERRVTIKRTALAPKLIVAPTVQDNVPDDDETRK
ncbi:MAG: PDZ domain-containing protein [Desulfuromonadales bacterium]